MRKILCIAILLSIASFVTGCASIGGYFVDRGRDAADIITATAGVGLGAKGRIGPLQTGLLIEAPQIGVRGGEFSADNPLLYMANTSRGASGEAIGITQGEEEFHMVKLDRHKEFYSTSIDERIFVYKVKDQYSAPYYYTQIEAVIAIGLSIRIGFNPGELLDFILSWTTIDIYGDDLEARKRRERVEPKPDGDGLKPAP